VPTRIEQHPGARAEIREAYRWYLERNRKAADGFYDRVEQLVGLAQDFPGLGSPYLFATRRLLLQSFPYMLVYRRRADDLQIIAVAHTSRRPGYWRDRLD
jgi:plasmid stabilization system protein ParE